MLSPRQTADHGSAHVGSLLTREQGEVPVVLSVKDVVSTHLAILASTGSGKSYTAGVLVEELMHSYNRASVLIVDPHGEYHTMQSIMGDKQFFGDDGYKPEVKIFTPDKIKVRFSTLTEADVKYLLPEGTSDKMLHFLGQAFRSLNDQLKAEGKRDYLYSYYDLRDARPETAVRQGRRERRRRRKCFVDPGSALAARRTFRSAGRHFFGERTHSASGPVSTRPLHDSSAFRHRTARAAGDRRHPAPPRRTRRA